MNILYSLWVVPKELKQMLSFLQTKFAESCLFNNSYRENNDI